jgi:hypothetical protein
MSIYLDFKTIFFVNPNYRFAFLIAELSVMEAARLPPVNYHEAPH